VCVCVRACLFLCAYAYEPFIEGSIATQMLNPTQPYSFSPQEIRANEWQVLGTAHKGKLLASFGYRVYTNIRRWLQLYYESVARAQSSKHLASSTESLILFRKGNGSRLTLALAYEPDFSYSQEIKGVQTHRNYLGSTSS